MTPVSALFQHAVQTPEEPWLFFRPALDWRWRSWRHLAVQAATAVERLTALDGPLKVAFPVATTAEAAPDAVVMDLAVQCVGGTAVPVAAQPGDPAWGDALEAAQCTAQLLPPGSLGQAVPGVRAVELPAPPAMFSSQQPPAEPPRDRSGEAAVVLADGTPLAVPRCLETTARGFTPLAPAPRRDVLVLAGDFREFAARLLLTWATQTGAVVLLEPDARLGLAATRWARPTVLWGGLEVLEGWRREARSPSRWQRRRGCPFAPPLDRLRALLVVGEDALPGGALDFWGRAGVLVLRLV